MNIMMRTGILIFLVSLFSISAFGQREVDEDASWDFRDRAYTGIGFGGLSFGNHRFFGQYFSIGASVLGGYMLTKNLSTGVGFEYQYTSYRDLRIKNHLYGGYPFIRYNIKNFFLQTDYSMYSVQVDINADEREMMDRFFFGAGFSSPTRGRAFMNFLVSYDLKYSNTGRWGSPLNTRLFFTF